MIVEMYEDLRPLTLLDPLLLPMLVYACRSGDPWGVVNVIPTYLSAALLSKLLGYQRRFLTIAEVCYFYTTLSCI